MNRVNGPSLRRNTHPPRDRILFADADRIRTRIQDAAADLRLTGARQHVLKAALKLLCGWARISDDYVRIEQIIDLCAPEHRHDPKTVGRELKALTALQMLVYTPARGRGKRATIAIHPRFLDGIAELERDDEGKVITFSGASPYYSQRELPLSESKSTDNLGKRPTEVAVNSKDVRAVFRRLAGGPLASLPSKLRWCLSGEIRKYLARGWRPDQIAEILNAPTPDEVHRPFRLAKWRLTKNMIGNGPRLTPLQRAWDKTTRAAERMIATATEQRLDTEIATHTTPWMRQRMLVALEHKLHAGLVDEAAALRQATRIARREAADGTPMRQAIEQWLADNEPAEDGAPTIAADTDTCVFCSEAAPMRNELPIPMAVCDCCMPTDELAAAA